MVYKTSKSGEVVPYFKDLAIGPEIGILFHTRFLPIQSQYIYGPTFSLDGAQWGT